MTTVDTTADIDTCDECGEPTPTTHTDRDGIAYWDCCGQEVRCPRCRNILIVAYHDEIGGYCRNCGHTPDDRGEEHPSARGHDGSPAPEPAPAPRPGHNCTCGSRRNVRVIPHVGPLCRRCRSRLAALISTRRAAR